MPTSFVDYAINTNLCNLIISVDIFYSFSDNVAQRNETLRNNKNFYTICLYFVVFACPYYSPMILFSCFIFFFFHNLIQTFLFIYVIICLFIWLFCFFVYLLTHSLSHSFIHSFIYLFVYSYDQKFPFCQIRGFQAMSLLRNFILCSFILNTFWARVNTSWTYQ